MEDPSHSPPIDPFESPAGSEASPDKTVLTVDRNATLTLGTDSLIIFDEGLRHRRSAANCCGLFPQFSKTTRSIPFHNILWAEFTNFDLTVHYAQPVGRKACTAGLINYNITDKSLHTNAREWAERLMERAYPPSVQRQKRVKVLVNPFGGQGYAQKIWSRAAEPIFAAARLEVDVESTTYQGHATEIASKMDIDAYDAIVCASGDGLPHEVFNGLAKHKDPRTALRKIAVVQIPCGSGNALSLNLNGTVSPSLAALEIVKGTRTPLDLVAITQGEKTIYSFLSQAVGIIAETDLGTESLRWMGSFRFTWGIIVRLLGKTIYPAEVSVVVASDDKKAIRDGYYKARKEIEAPGSANLRTDAATDASSNGGDAQLPALKYGTISDELSSEFVTHDMATLGNFYVGNACWMSADAPFFAAALPSDGQMDMLTADGNMPRLKALSMVMTLENGTIMNFPETGYRKILAYRISPRPQPTPPRWHFWARVNRWLSGNPHQTVGLIAIDGESIPFAPFQAEIVPSLGTVLSKHRGVYEFDGPLSP